MIALNKELIYNNQKSTIVLLGDSMAVVTPDLPELFEEAYERAGLEMRSGYDLKTARRSFGY